MTPASTPPTTGQNGLIDPVWTPTYNENIANVTATPVPIVPTYRAADAFRRAAVNRVAAIQTNPAAIAVVT